MVATIQLFLALGTRHALVAEAVVTVTTVLAVAAVVWVRARRRRRAGVAAAPEPGAVVAEAESVVRGAPDRQPA